MDNKYLTYRGELRALIALGGSVVFTTVHPEGQPTALYTLDADKLQLRAEPLPCGAIGLAGGAEGVWVLGVDGAVYAFPGTGKAASGVKSDGQRYTFTIVWMASEFWTGRLKLTWRSRLPCSMKGRMNAPQPHPGVVSVAPS